MRLKCIWDRPTSFPRNGHMGFQHDVTHSHQLRSEPERRRVFCPRARRAANPLVPHRRNEPRHTSCHTFLAARDMRSRSSEVEVEEYWFHLVLAQLGQQQHKPETLKPRVTEHVMTTATSVKARRARGKPSEFLPAPGFWTEELVRWHLTGAIEIIPPAIGHAL